MSHPPNPDENPLRRDQLVQWFVAAQKKRGQLIGTEQEKFGLATAGPEGPGPIRYREHVAPMLQGLVDRFGWEVAPDRGTGGEIIALRRGGASITLEPGGQLELSGAPLPTIHDTCSEFTQHYREVHAVAEPLGLTFICAGFHPFATHDEIDWMPKGRYGVMRRYLPTRGDRALDMMVRTCTVQANLDYADEAQCGRRLRITMGISPVITAMFANSPYVEGRATGLKSNRSAVWERVDPDRCGILPWVFDEPFSYERYVDWALNVPMFFVRRDGRYMAHHATFAEYMRDGFVDSAGQRLHAIRADWELHLNTLFPEVRLNPYIEIRGADSVGSKYVCALPALCKGLFYDDEARDAAWELVAGFDFAQRLALLHEGRTRGLGAPRIQAMARTLLRLACDGLDRLDVRDTQGRTEARFLASLEDLVTRGRSPADDVLETVGPDPGRGPEGRRALVRAFYFAGADV